MPPKSDYLYRIYTLLNKGFTKEELLHLCDHLQDFKPVCDQLTPRTSKAEIIRRLVEYAAQKLLINTLLAWAKERNPAEYEKYQPYTPDNLPNLANRFYLFCQDPRNENFPVWLRLDVAVSDYVILDRVFDLAVAIRQPSSLMLTENDLLHVHSGGIQLSWPESKPYSHLRIQVNAPECTIEGENNCSLRLYKGQDSPVFYFQLIPRKEGRISIIVIVYQEDDWLGGTRISTMAYKEVVGSVQVEITSQDLLQKPSDLEGHLRRLYAQHMFNLEILEEQKAKYGIQVPLHILNELEYERQALIEIEAKLLKFKEDPLDPTKIAGSFWLLIGQDKFQHGKTPEEKAEGLFMVIEAHWHRNPGPRLEEYAQHWLWANTKDYPEEVINILLKKYPPPEKPMIKKGYSDWGSFGNPAYK